MGKVVEKVVVAVVVAHKAGTQKMVWQEDVVD